MTSPFSKVRWIEHIHPQMMIILSEEPRAPVFSYGLRTTHKITKKNLNNWWTRRQWLWALFCRLPSETGGSFSICNLFMILPQPDPTPHFRPTHPPTHPPTCSQVERAGFECACTLITSHLVQVSKSNFKEPTNHLRNSCPSVVVVHHPTSNSGFLFRTWGCVGWGSMSNSYTWDMSL